VFDAFRRIASEEGVTSLWTGGVITMARACAMNVSMLVSYDETKERLTKSMPDASPRKIQVCSSLVASVFCAVGVLPFDNVKTKLQN